jgi:hypothetical protein
MYAQVENPCEAGADALRAGLRRIQAHLSDAAFQQLAVAFVDAFNRRDVEAWSAVFHPNAEFRPTRIAGSPRSRYQTRDGVRRYMLELRSRDPGHQARIRKIRRLGGNHFVVLTDVLIAGETVSPGTAIVRLEDGLIIEATAYLSDDETLTKLGLVAESQTTAQADLQNRCDLAEPA